MYCHAFTRLVHPKKVEVVEKKHDFSPQANRRRRRCCLSMAFSGTVCHTKAKVSWTHLWEFSHPGRTTPPTTPFPECEGWVKVLCAHCITEFRAGGHVASPKRELLSCEKWPNRTTWTTLKGRDFSKREVKKLLRNVLHEIVPWFGEGKLHLLLLYSVLYLRSKGAPASELPIISQRRVWCELLQVWKGAFPEDCWWKKRVGFLFWCKFKCSMLGQSAHFEQKFTCLELDSSFLL